jgi:hypothetical protein
MIVKTIFFTLSPILLIAQLSTVNSATVTNNNGQCLTTGLVSTPAPGSIEIPAWDICNNSNEQQINLIGLPIPPTPDLSAYVKKSDLITGLQNCQVERDNFVLTCGNRHYNSEGVSINYIYCLFHTNVQHISPIDNPIKVLKDIEN